MFASPLRWGAFPERAAWTPPDETGGPEKAKDMDKQGKRQTGSVVTAAQLGELVQAIKQVTAELADLRREAIHRCDDLLERGSTH